MSDVKSESFSKSFKHIKGDFFKRGSYIYIRFIDLFGDIRYIRIGYVSKSNKDKK